MSRVYTRLISYKRGFMEDYLRVGVLSSPHGVRGEVSVYPTTDDIERFRSLKEAFISVKGEMIPVHVISCKFKKNMPVLGFEEYKNIDDIAPLRGSELYVDRSNAVPLEDGEYFLADIIGFDVIAEDKKIGVIKDYIENEASQVIFVVSCEDGTEKYIPDVPHFISEVDLEEGKVYANLIKGM